MSLITVLFFSLSEEIRREIKSIKRDLQSKNKKENQEEEEEESEEIKKKRELHEVKEQYRGELEMYRRKAQEIPRKGLYIHKISKKHTFIDLNLITK